MKIEIFNRAKELQGNIKSLKGIIKDVEGNKNCISFYSARCNNVCFSRDFDKSLLEFAKDKLTEYEKEFEYLGENTNVDKIEDINYNELFKELQKSCERENCCNAFRYISLGELEELNNLLDRLLLFCENIKREELEDYEFGNKVFELYELADTLFSRDC